MDEKSTREEMVAAGTRWLLELELLNNEHMKNALILNIYKLSSHIKDVELLIDQPKRKMLIYLGLSGFGKMFKKRELSRETLNMLTEVLPSFDFRVIFDAALFLRAIKGLERSLASRTTPKAKEPEPAPQAPAIIPQEAKPAEPATVEKTPEPSKA